MLDFLDITTRLATAAKTIDGPQWAANIEGYDLPGHWGCQIQVAAHKVRVAVRYCNRNDELCVTVNAYDRTYSNVGNLSRWLPADIYQGDMHTEIVKLVAIASLLGDTRG